MSIISTIAVSGLQASVAKIANAANNIVNSDSEGFIAKDVSQKSQKSGGVTVSLIDRPDNNISGAFPIPNVDITEELISIELASQAYKANATVIAKDKELSEALLNVLQDKD